MNDIFPELPHTLGVYTLTHRIGAREHSEIYAATQSHVDRKVLIEVLRPNTPQTVVSQFLKTARARVTAKLPHVASVFESMVSDGTWYITQEKPNGTCLEVLHQQGTQLTPLQICTILETAAKLYVACNKDHLQAAPLSRTDIFIVNTSNGCSASFLSPVYDNAAQPTTGADWLAGVAEALAPMQPTNTAGQTRIATLLKWMKDGYEGQYLDWPAVEYTVEMLKEQLGLLQEAPLTVTNDKTTPGSIRRAKLKQRRELMRRVRFGIKCLIILVFCIIIGRMLAPSESELISPLVDDYITCTADQNKTRFYVAAAPVSIVDYERFLADYADMSTAEKAAVNRGLPQKETDHTPAAWTEQLQAAEANKQWQGRKMSESAPVTGVSYWDARAYANYRKAKLPDIATLHSVNESYPTPGICEWVTNTAKANTIHIGGHVVVQPDGKSTKIVPNPAHKDTSCGFRIVLPSPPNT